VKLKINDVLVEYETGDIYVMEEHTYKSEVDLGHETICMGFDGVEFSPWHKPHRVEIPRFNVKHEIFLYAVCLSRDGSVDFSLITDDTCCA